MAEVLRDMDITRDELDRISEAMKKEEFRKMLVEYCEELNDPVARKQYEEEITLLEQERGVEVTFIHPKPFYVIKTSVDDLKMAFINVSTNDKVGKLKSKLSKKEGSQGMEFSLPHMLSPPREDYSKKGMRANVYDVIFHPEVVSKAKNPAFRAMLTNIACEAVESNFNVTLDKNNLKFPNLKYKGMSRPVVVRKQVQDPPQKTNEETPVEKIYTDLYRKIDESSHKYKTKKQQQKENKVNNKSPYTIPKYIIKQRSDIDLQEFTNHNTAKMNTAIPNALVIEIKLPLLKSASDLILDVTDKTLSMISEKPSKYKLEISLPYTVNENNGNAKFDPDSRQLVVTLPVTRKSNLLLSDIGRDDSGVDSDTTTNENNSLPLIQELCIDDSAVGNSSVQSESEVFRTKVSSFLDDKCHYSLPEYSCHVFNNILAFTIHVKNVDSNSIEKLCNESSTSLHLKFTSISSGFFPLFYAFYIKLTSHIINIDDINIETWDNNLVMQIPYITNDKILTVYLVGTDEENAVEKIIEEPSIINKKLIEEINENNNIESNPSIHVNATNDEVKLVINQQESEEPVKDMPKSKSKVTSPNKNRSYSESSGDELCESHSPTKGILKLNRRHAPVSRSVSESSVDDYMWSSFENCASISDSLIPEEGEENSLSLKKTVRFNKKISTKLYRSNSSILGQRIKNQRKNKNKKRAQDRKRSESETSEGEEKKEKSSKDSDDSTDRDVKDNESIEQVQMEFKSDLIFDLDM